MNNYLLTTIMDAEFAEFGRAHSAACTEKASS